MMDAEKADDRMKSVILDGYTKNPGDLRRDAPNDGRVHAAGPDVVSAEPIRADNPLPGAKNCFVTPHISWAPKEARERIMDCTAKNLRSFLAGAPVNVVN